MEKVVVVYSGGMDSTTLLYDLAESYALYPLSFAYGQRHEKELYSAYQIAHILKLPLFVCDLRNIQPLLKGSALTSFDVPVPDGHYTEETMRATVVPNRNAIMMSLAWAYATSIGATAIATAVHAGDHTIYPDCREPFIKALEKAFALGTDTYSSCSRILTPYINSSKSDIVLRGHTLKVPYEHTWSCYKGESVHCGTCGTCVERKEAFVLAGVLDPTTYTT